MLNPWNVDKTVQNIWTSHPFHRIFDPYQITCWTQCKETMTSFFKLFVLPSFLFSKIFSTIFPFLMIFFFIPTLWPPRFSTHLCQWSRKTHWMLKTHCHWNVKYRCLNKVYFNNGLKIFHWNKKYILLYKQKLK